MKWRQDKSGLILPARLYEKPRIVRYYDRDRNYDRDGRTPREDGGPSGFNVVVELIASAGAEKFGSVQCTDNNDQLIHFDSRFDAYRFARSGVHLYRKPMDEGGPGSAPDQDGEGVRLATDLTNASALENLSRAAFTIIARTWIAVQGAADRNLWKMWITGPSAQYRSGGADTMKFFFPGDPGRTLTIAAVPEGQMVTVLMRFDGTTVYGAVYDADGTTEIGSNSDTVTTLSDAGDTWSFQTPSFHLKRAAAISGFVEGPQLDLLLESVLTDDPLPVA